MAAAGAEGRCGDSGVAARFGAARTPSTRPVLDDAIDAPTKEASLSLGEALAPWLGGLGLSKAKKAKTEANS